MKNTFNLLRPSVLSSIFVVMWWGLIAMQSLFNLGLISTVIFVLFPIIAVWLYPRNVLPFLLATFFVPIGAIQLPRAFVVLFAVVLLARVLRIHPNLKKLSNSFNCLLLGWLLVCAIMVLVSPNIFYGFDIFLKHFQTVIFCLIFQMFINSVEDINYAIIWICIFGGLAFVISLGHWIWFDHAWLTQKVLTSASEWSLIGKNTLSGVDHTRRFTWAGVDPNFYALNLMFPFFVSLGLALTSSKIKRMGYSILLLLCMTGILGTYSRSAFVVTIFLLFLFINHFKRQTLMIGIVLAVIFMISIRLVPSVQHRIISIENNLKVRGATGRIESSITGLYLYTENPLGAGLGSSHTLFVQANKNKWQGGHVTAHNTYVQNLLETGPLGLTLFLGILFLGLRGLYESIKIARVIKNKSQEILYIGMLYGSLSSLIFAATIPLIDFKIIFLQSVIGYSLYRYNYTIKTKKSRHFIFSRIPIFHRVHLKQNKLFESYNS